MSARLRGVPGHGVALGALVGLALLAGIVTLAEGLRHPHPEGQVVPPAEAEADDPRTEVDCQSIVPDGVPGSPSLSPRTAPPTVSSSDLHDCPATFDQARVTYQGEVVGAVLRRREGAWLQLNDDVYAGAGGPLPAHRDYRGGNAGVGVFVPHEVADRIDVVGGPHHHGDVLSVTGQFHRVDRTSGEASVIRATGGQVVRPGRPFEDRRLPDREVAALALGLLAILLVARERVHAVRWHRG